MKTIVINCESKTETQRTLNNLETCIDTKDMETVTVVVTGDLIRADPQQIHRLLDLCNSDEHMYLILGGQGCFANVNAKDRNCLLTDGDSK